MSVLRKTLQRLNWTVVYHFKSPEFFPWLSLIGDIENRLKHSAQTLVLADKRDVFMAASSNLSVESLFDLSRNHAIELESVGVLVRRLRTPVEGITPLKWITKRWRGLSPTPVGETPTGGDRDGRAPQPIETTEERRRSLRGGYSP